MKWGEFKEWVDDQNSKTEIGRLGRCVRVMKGNERKMKFQNDTNWNGLESRIIWEKRESE